jgi:DNA-binding transcriptional MerR regulator
VPTSRDPKGHFPDGPVRTQFAEDCEITPLFRKMSVLIDSRLDSGVHSRVYRCVVSRGQTSNGLQIGAVASRSGLTVDTVRFYEKQGLVAKPPRSTGGFRLYTESAIERLGFVSRAQALGFSLGEIRELLLLKDAGGETCPHVHDLVEQKLTVVQAKIAELRTLERQLKAAKSRCDQALTRDCAGNCPVMDEMTRNVKEVQ